MAEMPSTVATIEYGGVTVEYDAAQVKSFKNTRALAHYEKDPDGFFEAVDRILCGKANDVADAVGDDMTTMADLVAKVTEKVGGAKN